MLPNHHPQLAADAEKKALRVAKRDVEKSAARAKKKLFTDRDERGRTPLHMGEVVGLGLG